MPEARWFLCSWYACADFPTSSDLRERSFLGRFRFCCWPVRGTAFGVQRSGCFPVGQLTFRELELFWLTSCLYRCRSACSQVPGSYLPRIGSHYSIVTLFIRLSYRSRVPFILFCAVSGICGHRRTVPRSSGGCVGVVRKYLFLSYCLHPSQG